LFDFLTSTKRPASGTPVLPAAQVIERLNREINAIVDQDDVKRALGGQAISAEASTPEKLRDLIRTDLEKWRAIAAKAGIRAE